MIRKPYRASKNKPEASTSAVGRPHLAEARRVVGELRALRRKSAKRPGFGPLTDKEIRDAIDEGRP
jgi:hypothetical protein